MANKKIDTEEKRFVVLRGNVGIYTTSEEAIVNAYGRSPQYIIAVDERDVRTIHRNHKFYNRILTSILNGVVVDIRPVASLLSSYDAVKLQRIYASRTYANTYVARIINDSGYSKYGILIDHKKRYYCALSHLSVDRGVYTDHAPYFKLLELTRQYDFHGKLRTCIPIPEELKQSCELNWQVEYEAPYQMSYPMSNLISLLETGECISEIELL